MARGERKSAEPIAARACGDEAEAQHTHDKILHFLAWASWDDRAVRRVAARYALLTTLPRRLSKKQIVRVTKERWRTERVYEELKGELGLDHFEGRSFAGWHHHISVVLCCFAFVVAERVPHFPPSQGWQDSTGPLRLAA